MSAVPHPQLLPKFGEPFSPWNVFQKPEERHRAVNNWRKRTGAPWSAVALLLYLFDRAARNYCCWPHFDIISHDLGLSENQIRRVMAEIERRAAVVVKAHGPLGNEYVLLWHEAYIEALHAPVRIHEHRSKTRQRAPKTPTITMVGSKTGETDHHNGGHSSRLPVNEKPGVDEKPIQSTATPQESAADNAELIEAGTQPPDSASERVSIHRSE